jgi:hypothetical protein
MNLRTIFLFSITVISCLVILSSVSSLNSTTESNLEPCIEIGKSSGIKNSPTSLTLHELIEKYSDIYSIPKYIAYNIAFLETRYQGPFHWSYNPSRTSPVGAVGPMQIMPATAKLINKTSVPVNKLRNDIDLNIEISMKLLRRLYNKYPNWAIVCGCYNTGRPIINGYAKFCSTNKDYQKNWNYLLEN